MAHSRDTATIPDPSVPGGDSTLEGVQKVSTAVDDLYTDLNVTDAKIVAASETVSGVVELATTTEAADGTDTERAVTPAGVEAHFDGKVTAFAQTLLDDADASTARTTLGLEIGTDVEAADSTILKDADVGVTVQGYDADTAKNDTAQEWTAAQTYADDTVSISSGSISWDMQDKPKAEVSLTENVTTWTVTNAGPGELWLIQDATGGRTVAWPAAWLWPGGEAGAVTADANAVDILTLTERGGTLYATLINDFKVVV